MPNMLHLDAHPDAPSIDVRLTTAGGATRVYHVNDEDGARLRVLDVAGAVESATYEGARYCELALGYTQMFDVVFRAPVKPRRLAMLGGGGFSYPKHIICDHPECTIDVVEIDEALVDVAYEFFFLDRLEAEYHAQAQGRLNIHIADAFVWLSQQTQHFDAILNDCYVGHEPSAVLASSRAARLIHTRLSDTGVYATNVVAPLKGLKSRPLRQLYGILSGEFNHVWVLPLSQHKRRIPDNNIVVASDVVLDMPEAYRL